MKIEFEKKNLANGVTLYLDQGSRSIYFNFPGSESVKECEPPYKWQFQPEKKRRMEDLEHNTFVACLKRAKLHQRDKPEFDRRVARGRPICVYLRLRRTVPPSR
eukprot:5636017-Prymnesium_polylepis.1